LPSELFEELIHHHTSIVYPRDAVIFEQSSPADLMFFMVAGIARLEFLAPEGRPRLLRLAGPGDLLGNVDFLDSKSRGSQGFAARALTRCSVGVITREHALKVLRALDPATLLRLLEQINTRWSALAYWYAGLFHLSFRRRLEAVLGDLAERYGVQDKRRIILTPELTHGDLAEMIGSSRPTVSRLMGQMLTKHVLARHAKQYIILDGRVATKIVPFNSNNGAIGHKGLAKSHAASHANQDA